VIEVFIDSLSELNYSWEMDEEITTLEAKLTELVNAVGSLRQENNEMKPSVEKLQEENKILKAKINEATMKIENLLGQFPN
jgi:FtsZ-binding cell division protein ZapB